MVHVKIEDRGSSIKGRGSQYRASDMIQDFIAQQPEVTYFEGSLADFMREFSVYFNALNHSCNEVSPDGVIGDEVFGKMLEFAPGSYVTVIAVRNDTISFAVDPVTGMGRFSVSGRSSVASRLRMKAKQIAVELHQVMSQAVTYVKSVRALDGQSDWTITMRVNTSLAKRNSEMEASEKGSSQEFGRRVADLELFADAVRII